MPDKYITLPFVNYNLDNIRSRRLDPTSVGTGTVVKGTFVQNITVSGDVYVKTVATTGSAAVYGVAMHPVTGVAGVVGNVGVLPLNSFDLVEVTAGAAVAVGANLTSDATGRAITATTGNTIVAIAEEVASAAGDLIRVRLVGHGNVA